MKLLKGFQFQGLVRFSTLILLSLFFSLAGCDELEDIDVDEQNKDQCQNQQVGPDESVIHFSGMCWAVSNDDGGPGCNRYSDTTVWKDGDGNLHLNILKERRGGGWYCASLEALEAKGYGTYTFNVKSNLTRLDKNVVFGMFLYENVENSNNPDEIDIEITRWGENIPKDSLINYTIYKSNPGGNGWKPTANDGHHYKVKKPENQQQFSIRWTPDEIQFKANNGQDYQEFTYDGSGIPEASDEKLHLNFWLNDKDDSDDENEQCCGCGQDKGVGDPPSDGQAQEVVIESVNYVPY